MQERSEKNKFERASATIFRSVWGEANSFLHLARQLNWMDLLLLAGLSGLLAGSVSFWGEATGVSRPAVDIDLSFGALPLYAFFSLSRGLIAFVISALFTLVYGYWAAKDPRAEKILVPMLDVLQSIPVLGFMPGLVLAMVALFRHSNLGLELAAILMIFSGQAWNMTFSFYHSLRSVPRELVEASEIYGFSAWQRLRWVELPSATTGLVWNGMMSMAGGWFFLMINEAFQLGDRDFRLPGLGSYMSVAASKGDIKAMSAAIVAMVIMIVALDQLCWRPLVVWSRRFRVEESADADLNGSWFGDLVARSGIGDALLRRLRRRRAPAPVVRQSVEPAATARSPWMSLLPLLFFAVLVGALALGSLRLLHLLAGVNAAQWRQLAGGTGLTLVRVVAATALGALWALPVGIYVGLSPRLSRHFQPVVQVAASFPAPMLFPAVVALLAWMGIGLGFGSVVILLLGTQWYILFNVLAGALAAPGDLKEAATAYKILGWRRFKLVNAPAVFPYLVTGLVTAMGGAWNASIVAEYVSFKGATLQTLGLGSLISQAAASADYPMLAAGVVSMSLVVVLLNRTLWKRLYHLAEERYSLNK